MADQNKNAEEETIASSRRPQAMAGIAHPGLDDVMFGRGGDTNYHIGNHRFRVLADGHRSRYRSSTSRKEKAVVVEKLVRIWREERGGRFLTKTDPEKGDESKWHDVGDQVARKKAAKILSEKVSQSSSAGDDENKSGKKKSNTNNGSNDRKRPAVDSIDTGRVVKQPNLLPQATPVAAGASATALTATLNTAAAVAHVFPHGAPQPQQVQPLVVPGPAAQQQQQQQQQQQPQLPSLQLPRTTPLVPTCQQQQASSSALTAATQALSTNLTLFRALQNQQTQSNGTSTTTNNNNISNNNNNDPLSNPLILAALGIVTPSTTTPTVIPPATAPAAMTTTDSTSSPQLNGLIAMAAAQLQRNEQDAARSRALLNRALLIDRLRTVAAATAAPSCATNGTAAAATTVLPPLPPTLPAGAAGTTTTTTNMINQPSISTMILAARLGLSPEELQLQLLSQSTNSHIAARRKQGRDGK